MRAEAGGRACRHIIVLCMIHRDVDSHVRTIQSNRRGIKHLDLAMRLNRRVRHNDAPPGHWHQMREAGD